MTIPTLPEELLTQIKQDEGLRLTAYQDTLGNWTIGYGHTPATEGQVWTLADAEAALLDDVDRAANDVDMAFPWAEAMGVIRWSVLVNMAFNMGLSRLQEFHMALEAMQAGNYPEAATQMLNSLWASQVGGRATRLAQQMETNRWVMA
jgi:lysozyme